MQTLKKYLADKRIIFALALSATVIFLCVKGAAFTPVSADSAADIQAQIDANNQKITAIQQEIDQYSTLLDQSSKQAQTLSSTLQSLELTQKKLEAQLSLTSKQISKTGLSLQQVKKDIASTEAEIAPTQAAVAETVREIALAEQQSPIEDLLNNRDISATWNYIDQTETLQSQLKSKYEDLNTLETLLRGKQDQATGEQAQLQSYLKSLSDQQQVLAMSVQEKNQLLSETNSREASYRSLIAQKTAEMNLYEQQQYDYESKLSTVVSPSSAPAPRHGILSWPLDHIQVTQYFGKTVDARRLYVSGTHGGVDFRAAIGTPVKAALSGVIEDTEPTKYRSGCQYGKYVLIKHPNGLSTIYGHLSLVTVKPGDPVLAGDVIGYSGDTGYAIGPHLHFGLYITADIRIVDSSALGSVRCAGIKTVAAPPDAYLDPMAYLPVFKSPF
ncbi:MAG: peptidoglycan DD-metalloendopeptidase family protein [Patescibacteria group bacterium]|nr:peptidoglycan DD-metalloendopeptidase family protein [Patescibacteria group bacterium]MDE2116479.1 peptidoglycan DD-metalloendopeptidase family protein [Patescibacteria group bacterium]